MRTISRTPLRFAGLLVAATLVLAGCDDDPVQPADPLVQLEGFFEPAEGYDDIFGSAILVVYENAFSVTVAAQETPAPGNDGHPWVLLDGTCETPGDVVADVGDLPGIEFDSEGQWAETGIEFDLGEPTSLALELRLSTADSETVIACATLTED